MSLTLGLFGLLCLASILNAFPLPSKRQLSTSVQAPSVDPWYIPPAGYQNAAPGAILANREIPIPLAITLVSATICESAWQVMYRTTDDMGNAIAAVTTIFVPTSGDPEQFFTQSIAYDASNNDCSPSYVLRELTSPQPDIAAIALALDSGWYVQSPDFETLSASFTNGIISGHSMLDSLRAGLQSTAFTGLSSTPRITLNGGSGGALAIEWALELQSTYAPELTITGASLGSLTPNIADVMNTVDGGAFAGLIPASITGLAQRSSAMDTYLTNNLVPATASTFRAANNTCLTQNQANFASQNISSYFTSSTWIQDPEIQAIIQSIGIMGLHGTPQVPLYIYKGAEDELSAVADTDALVEKYCASGITPSITYLRDVVTGHETESFIGFVGAYEWLQERMNGVPAVEGCTIINSTKSTLNNTDATALGNLGPTVVNILKNALPALLSE